MVRRRATFGRTLRRHPAPAWWPTSAQRDQPRRASAPGARWLITRDPALLKLRRELEGMGLAIATPAAVR
jgi:hypothetical protein